MVSRQVDELSGYIDTAVTVGTMGTAGVYVVGGKQVGKELLDGGSGSNNTGTGSGSNTTANSNSGTSHPEPNSGTQPGATDSEMVGQPGGSSDSAPGTATAGQGASGSDVSSQGGSNVNIRDHHNHHQNMVDNVKDELAAQGYSVSNREVSFGGSCGAGLCRPDIIAEAPDGSIKIIEIKTGDAGYSIRQSEIFPKIENGNSTSRGRVAE